MWDIPLITSKASLHRLIPLIPFSRKVNLKCQFCPAPSRPVLSSPWPPWPWRPWGSWKLYEEVGGQVVHKEVGCCLISYNLRLACIRMLEVIWLDRSEWMSEWISRDIYRGGQLKKTPCKIRIKEKKVLADWKSRDLTQEDCADLAAYGNIPSTDNLPLVSGNQVVYFFISPYGSIQANRQYTKDRNTAFVPKVWEID